MVLFFVNQRLDQEACIYADKVRSMRQKEYDNASLYSADEAEQAEQLEHSQCNFIEYFAHVADTRHANSSDSIIVKLETCGRTVKDIR